MLFAFSKLAFSVVAPGSFLAILLALGLLLAAAGGKRRAVVGRTLVVVAALGYLSIALLPVGEWALTPLENRFAYDPLPDQVDGIIVLGGDEQTQITETRGIPTALDSMRRYMTFTDLARRYPDAKLMFTGGPPQPRPHARIIDSDVAKEILTDMGIPPDRMTYERMSRNTYENAVFSADIARPQPTEKWLVVTSAWHMTRSIAIFRKAGWNAYPAPTGYFTTGDYHGRLFRFDDQMHLLTIAVHEYIGLVAYWALGRTETIWP
jgi:uncharacterized SAM-binding protein YcdF (DUF218 family)